MSAGAEAKAKSARARQLCSYAPFAIPEGIALAREAAAAGDTDAMMLLAFLTAEGLGVAQSWPVALDLLAKAATLGHARAEAERALLSGIDISAPFHASSPRALAAQGRIAAIDNFLAPELCDFLIAQFSPHMAPAKTIDSKTGLGAYHEARTNSAAEIVTHDIGLVLSLVRQRISALLRLPLIGFEDPTVLHYAPGEEFRPHYDFLDMVIPAYARDVAATGQRVLTFLVYLNEGFEGGETAFPDLSFRYKAPKGGALLFWNVLPNGQPDQRMLHAGAPTTRGEKWLLSQWVRAK